MKILITCYLPYWSILFFLLNRMKWKDTKALSVPAKQLNYSTKLFGNGPHINFFYYRFISLGNRQKVEIAKEVDDYLPEQAELSEDTT